jgi:hypothetical protein
MAVNGLVSLARGCIVRCEGAIGLGCGCRGYNGEGIRGHIVDLRARRCSGPWPRLVNSAGERCGRRTISYMVHLGSYWLCTDCCRHGRSGVVRELSGHRGHGNARIEGVRWLVRCRHMKGCWYRLRSAERVGVCQFLLDNIL